MVRIDWKSARVATRGGFRAESVIDSVRDPEYSRLSEIVDDSMASSQEFAKQRG